MQRATRSMFKARPLARGIITSNSTLGRVGKWVDRYKQGYREHGAVALFQPYVGLCVACGVASGVNVAYATGDPWSGAEGFALGFVITVLAPVSLPILGAAYARWLRERRECE